MGVVVTLGKDLFYGSHRIYLKERIMEVYLNILKWVTGYMALRQQQQNIGIEKMPKI
jgi:hypothetical protein